MWAYGRLMWDFQGWNGALRAGVLGDVGQAEAPGCGFTWVADAKVRMAAVPQLRLRRKVAEAPLLP